MTDGNLMESDLQSKTLQQFKVDVSNGLNADPRTLPSKYFYDEIGDDLFVQIMHLPEYYLTRSEMEIFTEQTEALIGQMQLDKNKPFELIELGAGDGAKTVHLLQKLIDQSYNFTYNAVDISTNALEGLADKLTQELPELKMEQLPGDYFKMLSRFKGNQVKKVVLFLGSNIGNMSDQQAASFLYQLGSNLAPGDMLILGADLMKPEEIVLPAYNDSQGVTAAFNLNLLRRLNNELNANFNLDQFSHAPTYDEEKGIAKSFIRSDADQEVYIEGIGQDFYFEKGALIQTEMSRKYDDAVIKKLIQQSDFVITGKLMDSKKFFADYILQRQ